VVTGLRFALCAGRLLYDPTCDEEKTADGCCTVVMSNEEEPKLMKLTTSGRFRLDRDVIARMVAAVGAHAQ
jgi:exosome complex RNA-binding protein Rrp42 (RNase PH superfamily)